MEMASGGQPLEDASVHQYLSELLNGGPYRRLWLPYAARLRPGRISSAAVGQVVASYLWDSGIRDERDTDLPRKLKDRVSRAVAGGALSAETLSWFTHAFGFTEEEQTELWRRHGAAIVERVIPGDRSEHRTISLHELHYVGANRIPERHETIHIVKALVDGLKRYVYIIDTDEASVGAVRGGTAGPLYEFDRERGLWATDITFHRPLRKGQVASLNYVTRFRYRKAPDPVFRRYARRLVENLELSVQFHPASVPDRIWWARWKGLEPRAVEKEKIKLDKDRAAPRYLTRVNKTTVGFEWEWRTP